MAAGWSEAVGMSVIRRMPKHRSRLAAAVASSLRFPITTGEEKGTVRSLMHMFGQHRVRRVGRFGNPKIPQMRFADCGARELVFQDKFIVARLQQYSYTPVFPSQPLHPHSLKSQCRTRAREESPSGDVLLQLAGNRVRGEARGVSASVEAVANHANAALSRRPDLLIAHQTAHALPA